MRERERIVEEVKENNFIEDKLKEIEVKTAVKHKHWYNWWGYRHINMMRQIYNVAFGNMEMY